MSGRMKLTLAYLGRGFLGWQRQAEGRTVQGELEAALARVLGRPVQVTGAGRTDAGVHAAGQVAHVDVPVDIPAEGLRRALSGELPRDLRVRAVRPVPPRFHARRDATAKLYVYRARWRPSPLPWADLRHALVRRPSDLGALQAAARMLVGRHDVASFSVTDPTQGPTVRTLFSAEVSLRPGGAVFRFCGDGFLRYQVRRMVGAAFELGWGQRTTSQLRQLIEQPQPGASVWTAPAEGLTLERVSYRGGAGGRPLEAR